MIRLGRSLYMRVVAEGIETREQLTFLQRQRCLEGQGYYFGYPMPAEEFVQLLEGSAAQPSTTFGRPRKPARTSTVNAASPPLRNSARRLPRS